MHCKPAFGCPLPALPRRDPTAPAEPLAALQSLSSLPSPLHAVWWASGSLSPYTSHWSPPRTLLFAGHRNAEVTEDIEGLVLYPQLQKSQWFQKCKSIRVCKTRRQVGNENAQPFTGEGAGYHLRSSWVMGRAGLAPSSPAAPNTVKTLTPARAPGHGCNVNINTNEAFLLSLCTCCFPSLAVWEMACPTCWGPQKIVFI